MMRDGDIVEMDVGESLGWVGMAGIDADMRLLCGLKPVTELNTPAFIFDKSNVATAGKPATFDSGYGECAHCGFQEALGHSMTLAFPAARPAAGDALVVENLSKRFGGELALSGVSLSVRRGEVHGLLGANGSGKSTLIKILAGFHAPEPGGSMRLFDADLPLPVRADEAKELGLAFVHQNLALIPTLSLTENMRLTHFATAPDWRISWRREHDSVAATLARYGLRLNPRAPVSSLSSAEQALFAIVRAVEDLGPAVDSAGRNRLLVLDEPTPFLPRVGVDQLFALVRRIVSEGASVIFVSHDIAEVIEITDRATILRDGLLVDVLDTRSASHEDFVERIVGRSVTLFHVHKLERRETLPRRSHQRPHGGAGPRPGRHRGRQG